MLQEEKEASAKSIYALLSRLCQSWAHNVGKEHPNIGSLRAKCCEVILKSHPDDQTEIDVEQGLQIYLKNYHPYKTCFHRPAKRVDLQFVHQHPYFTDGPGRKVVQFLLMIASESNSMDNQNELVQPNALTLDMCYTLRLPCGENLKKSGSEFNELNQSRSNIRCSKRQNRYMPSHLTTCENHILNTLKEKLNKSLFPKYEKSKNILTPSVQSMWDKVTQNKSNKSGFYPKLCASSCKENVIRSQWYKKNIKLGVSRSPDAQIQKMRCQSWEFIGSDTLISVKPFTSESVHGIDLYCFSIQPISQTLQPQIITQDKFLEDLKSLTVGIQSDCFQCDKHNVFSMVPNLTLHVLLPSTVHFYVQEFMECGTCFRRIQTVIGELHTPKFDGFLYKTLFLSIQEYLISFRQFIFGYSDKTMVTYYKRMKNMMVQICALASTLSVHPNVSQAAQLPKRSCLLGYIYQEILCHSKNDIITLMVFLLRRCCYIYFRLLRNWIFCGELDDPYNELFICFTNQHTEKTRNFYEKAYYINKNAVPGFFQTYEDDILLCGRYTMLLKAWKPYHRLFDLVPPPMSVYITYEEMQKLKSSCVLYYNQARQLCGPPVTIANIFAQRALEKYTFRRTVAERTRVNFEKWSCEQKILADTLATQKQSRLNYLYAQLEEVEQSKVAERRAHVEFELKFRHEMGRNQDRELLNENIKMKMECYEQLKDLMKYDLADDINRYTSKQIVRNREGPAALDLQFSNEDDQNLSVYVDYSHCFPIMSDSISSQDHSLKVSLNGNNANLCSQSTNDVTTLRRSASDVLNSNNLPEFSKNRERAMGSTSMALCMQDFHQITKKDHYETGVLDMNAVVKDIPSKNVESLQDVNLNDITACEIEDRLQISISSSHIGDDISALLSHTQPLTPMSTSPDLLLDDYTCSRSCDMSDLENGNLPDQPTGNSDEESDITSQSHKSGKEQNTDGEYKNKAKSGKSRGSISWNDIKCPQNRSIPTCPTERSLQYKHCAELLTSRLACKPHSSLFQLAETEEQLYEKDRIIHLNCLNVVTLTELLQKSVVVPMKMYLEIVNQEVMRMLLEDLNILGHFRSLRNYFFLMDGEFGAIICDGIIKQLEDGATPKQLFHYQTLHTILDKALRSSIKGREKNGENLSFTIDEKPTNFDLCSPNVLENLSLNYRVEWPLNLILTSESLGQYSNIFKYLIKVRRMSWVMETIFQLLKDSVSKLGKDLTFSPEYRHIQLIRHKFYHFVCALRNHITSNALQGAWKSFKDELLTATSLEDMYRKHTNYLKQILFLCMLNKRSVEYNNTIDSIFKILLRFYNNLKKHDFKKQSGDEYYTHKRYVKLCSDELEFDKFMKFTLYLGTKIVRHGYQAELGQFITSINYNANYYVEDSY